jgi:hypothetical protein
VCPRREKVTYETRPAGSQHSHPAGSTVKLTKGVPERVSLACLLKTRGETLDPGSRHFWWRKGEENDIMPSLQALVLSWSSLGRCRKA